MTAQPMVVGDPLEVQIIHPLSEATFELNCKVRRLEPKAPASSPRFALANAALVRVVGREGAQRAPLHGLVPAMPVSSARSRRLVSV